MRAVWNCFVFVVSTLDSPIRVGYGATGSGKMPW